MSVHPSRSQCCAPDRPVSLRPASDPPVLIAGYDLATEAGFGALMADFESILGLHRLRAVHLNDSKSESPPPSGSSCGLRYVCTDRVGALDG